MQCLWGHLSVAGFVSLNKFIVIYETVIILISMLEESVNYVFNMGFVQLGGGSSLTAFLHCLCILSMDVGNGLIDLQAIQLVVPVIVVESEVVEVHGVFRVKVELLVYIFLFVVVLHVLPDMPVFSYKGHGDV